MWSRGETKASSGESIRSFVCGHSPWAPEEGGWYRLELPKESLWFVAGERDMGEQLLKTLIGSSSDTTAAIFTEQCNILQVATA